MIINDKVLFIIDGDREFIFDGNTFSPVPTKKVPKYFIASTVPSLNTRTHGYKTTKQTSLEKIEIQSEMNMYEDAGLDPDTDFKISSLIIPLEDGDEDFVESYAVEVDILNEKFDPFVKKYGHLDLIFPSALSYTALYNTETIDAKNDLYIHLGEHNAYAVIFKNGQYISTRTISTLDELARKIGVDIDKIREILSTKGVKDELYNDDEFIQMSDIQEELSKLVERIAHSIGHKRGIFKLDTIHNIYLDFEGLDIPGFLNLFDNYGYENSNKSILDPFKDIEIGMKHFALNAKYALEVAQEHIIPVNLTVYDRQPPFFKTNVGTFSVVMLLAIILASIYPIYAYITLESLVDKESELKHNVAQMQKKTKNLHAKLKDIRENKKIIKEKNNKKELKIKALGNMISALEEFDKNTLNRQRMMKDVNEAMHKYNLSSKRFELRDSDFLIVQVISEYSHRDNISEFIKELISLGYSNVLTKKVQKTETYYESFVEIHQ